MLIGALLILVGLFLIIWALNQLKGSSSTTASGA